MSCIKNFILQTLIKKIFPLVLLILFIAIQYILYQSGLLNVRERNFIILLFLQIDLLILLFLLYLIFRYLFRIFLEIRARKISKSLKHRLFTLYFLSLTFPTIILTLGGIYFLKKGLDYWFKEIASARIISEILKEEDFLKEEEAYLLMMAYRIRDEYISKVENIRNKDLRERYRYLSRLDSVEVYTLNGELHRKTYSPEITSKLGISLKTIETLMQDKKPQVQLQPFGSTLIMRVFIPVEDAKGNTYVLATGKIIEREVLLKKDLIGQLAGKEFTYFVILSLAIIFFLVLFLGLWVGDKLGRRLTEPLQSLIIATQKISRREYSLEDLPSPPDQEDEIATLIKSFRNMAEELKKYEETLRKYNEYLRTVLETLPVGILILRENFELLFINRTLKTWLESLRFEDLANFLDRFNLKDYLMGVDLHQNFYKVFSLSESGRDISFGITFMKLQLPDEWLYLLIIENLEEKEALKRLSLWREVAVKIAHEIKNPLTPIKLSIERLKRRLSEELSPEKRELLEKTVVVVNNYIEELRKLAQDFYYFSQRPLFERGKVNLLQNLQEVLELYRLSFPEVSINLRYDSFQEHNVIVESDPFQLRRVWINLLDNSIRSMNEQGNINITISTVDEVVRIVYEDEGQGIDENLCEAFNKKNLEELKKIGTGLLIVTGIVELSRGDIKVERREEGGVRFLITLPKA